MRSDLGACLNPVAEATAQDRSSLRTGLGSTSFGVKQPASDKPKKIIFLEPQFPHLLYGHHHF